MSVSAAFAITSNTFKLTAATSAPSPVQVTSSTLGGNQYRVINSSSSQGCFISYAMDSSTATTNCVIPVVGTPTKVLYLLPNTDEIISFVPNAYFTAITSANTCDLFIVAGDGM
jgi:hypothetical protein